jgi:hypothetical protein
MLRMNFQDFVEHLMTVTNQPVARGWGEEEEEHEEHEEQEELQDMNEIYNAALESLTITDQNYDQICRRTMDMLETEEVKSYIEVIESKIVNKLFNHVMNQEMTKEKNKLCIFLVFMSEIYLLHKPIRYLFSGMFQQLLDAYEKLCDPYDCTSVISTISSSPEPEPQEVLEQGQEVLEQGQEVLEQGQEVLEQGQEVLEQESGSGQEILEQEVLGQGVLEQVLSEQVLSEQVLSEESMSHNQDSDENWREHLTDFYFLAGMNQEFIDILIEREYHKKIIQYIDWIKASHLLPKFDTYRPIAEDIYSLTRREFDILKTMCVKLVEEGLIDRIQEIYQSIRDDEIITKSYLTFSMIHLVRHGFMDSKITDYFVIVLQMTETSVINPSDQKDVLFYNRYIGPVCITMCEILNGNKIDLEEKIKIVERLEYMRDGIDSVIEKTNSIGFTDENVSQFKKLSDTMQLYLSQA